MMLPQVNANAISDTKEASVTMLDFQEYFERNKNDLLKMMQKLEIDQGVAEYFTDDSFQRFRNIFLADFDFPGIDHTDIFISFFYA